VTEKRFCLCGCGESVKNKWVRGHHSRVNNISKRPDIREKRRERMQEWHNSGEWQPWNKGISDERTKKNGKAVADARGDGWRLKASENMKKVRDKYLGFGEKSPNWKGGTSPLHTLLRANKRLYEEWKVPILKRDGVCLECDSKNYLQVHHNKISMSSIMKLFVTKDRPAITWKEKKSAVEKIVQYHIDQKISGITLCKSCHKQKHANLNF